VIDSFTNDIVIYNTGVSVASTGKRLLLPHESELVIAHGHSWGSPHDPGTDTNCRLRYLMNEFIQDNSEGTHQEFSPCSRISIGRVLANKATCFQGK
uniref:Uncharacterized protein n=1 Tax=Amphimedon queenslandica TaxID=400682 RepID=A0A1X7TKQ2_AMPQE